MRGASEGEGLGNKFLANIRETNAILMMVRCFDDPNVIHVSGSVDPMRDIDIIDLELAPNSTPILVGRGSIDAGPLPVPFPVRTGLTCWASPSSTR